MEVKTNLTFRCGRTALQMPVIREQIWSEWGPVKGNDKYMCWRCTASYVGQTRRHHHPRISEHLRFSPLTGKQCKRPSPSSISTHLDSTKRTAYFDDFKIFSSCSDSYDSLIHESLLISKLKPLLNVQRQLF